MPALARLVCLCQLTRSKGVLSRPPLTLLHRARLDLPQRNHCFYYILIYNVDGKESENIKPVLLFLKETIPREAQTAQQALERFDESLVIMGLEEHMIKTGRRVALSGPDSATIAEEWMEVVKEYRSLLPVDEHPVGWLENHLVFTILQSGFVPGLKFVPSFRRF